LSVTLLLNTINHENWSLEPTQQNPKKPLFGGCLKEPEFQNFTYEVLEVGPKDSGSHNFSFLALKGKIVGVTQILGHTDNGNAIKSPDNITNEGLKFVLYLVKT
jgi:hypothetical protein